MSHMDKYMLNSERGINMNSIDHMKSVLEYKKAELEVIEEELPIHYKQIDRLTKERDEIIIEIGVLEKEIQLQEGTDTPETRIMN